MDKLISLCITALILYCLTVSKTAEAQEDWSLDSCYHYALAHNLDFQNSTIDYRESQLGVSQARLSSLPSLSATATHGYNWGQTIDPFTNQFATNRVQSNDFSVNGRLDIFSGLQKFYGRKKSYINQLSKATELDAFQVDLKTEIAQQFYDILMQQEVLKLAQGQLDFTQKKKTQIQQLVEANKLAKSEMVEIESIEAQDELSIVQAQNNLNISMLRLKQKLNLERKQLLNLRFENTRNIERISGTDVKTELFPEYQVAQKQIELKQLELAEYRSAYMPQIYISGSLGSGYSENNTLLLDDGSFRPKPLRDQLDENLYKSLVMTLSVPIFDGFNRSLAVQRTRLSIERARNNSMRLSREIDNQLEQLEMDIAGGYTKYRALQSTKKFQGLALETASARYDEGMIDLYDLEEARKEFLQVEIDLLKSQYELYVSLEIRDIYIEFAGGYN